MKEYHKAKIYNAEKNHTVLCSYQIWIKATETLKG